MLTSSHLIECDKDKKNLDESEKETHFCTGYMYTWYLASILERTVGNFEIMEYLFS